MTLMLASVTGPEEAEVAVLQGADIVDLKDVGAGFGTVATEVVRATVAAVARRRPVSAVVGETAAPERIAGIAADLTDAGANYVKVGLSPDLRRGDCIRALAPLARSTKVIGVMFADHGADNSLIGVIT